MVQPESKRLASRQYVADQLSGQVPTILGKQKIRRLGDQMAHGTKPGTIPATKAQVSVTENSFDGIGAVGTYYAYSPVDMITADVAECNWNLQTLGPYGSAYLNYSKSNTNATDMEATFMFEGKYLCIAAYKLAQIKQNFRIWIDDVEVTEWYYGTRATGVLQTQSPVIDFRGTDNQVAAVNINFAKRGIYKIRMAGVACSGTTGVVALNIQDRIFKPAKQRCFGVISDSWYDTIATDDSMNAATELAARMGWKQWNLAVGGSGFINPSAFAGGPHNYSSDAVFAALAKAPAMDFLLLNGSVNDMGYPQADVLTAMQTFFDRWRTVRPDTPIVWQGLEPQSYFENIYTVQAIVDRETAQKAKALADPNVIGVIESAKENWLTGTGNVNNLTGVGNQDFNTGTDGVHLSPAGNIFNSRMVFQRIQDFHTWKGAAA